jgi:hypothetical protein
LSGNSIKSKFPLRSILTRLGNAALKFFGKDKSPQLCRDKFLTDGGRSGRSPIFAIIEKSRRALSSPLTSQDMMIDQTGSLALILLQIHPGRGGGMDPEDFASAAIRFHNLVRNSAGAFFGERAPLRIETIPPPSSTAHPTGRGSPGPPTRNSEGAIAFPDTLTV